MIRILVTTAVTIFYLRSSAKRYGKIARVVYYGIGWTMGHNRREMQIVQSILAFTPCVNINAKLVSWIYTPQER